MGILVNDYWSNDIWDFTAQIEPKNDQIYLKKDTQDNDIFKGQHFVSILVTICVCFSLKFYLTIPRWCVEKQASDERLKCPCAVRKLQSSLSGIRLKYAHICCRCFVWYMIAVFVAVSIQVFVIFLRFVRSFFVARLNAYIFFFHFCAVPCGFDSLWFLFKSFSRDYVKWLLKWFLVFLIIVQNPLILFENTILFCNKFIQLWIYCDLNITWGILRCVFLFKFLRVLSVNVKAHLH